MYDYCHCKLQQFQLSCDIDASYSNCYNKPQRFYPFFLEYNFPTTTSAIYPSKQVLFYLRFFNIFF